MKIPRLKYRMNQKVVTMGKARLVDIMRELEPEKKRKSLEDAYDSMTRALNGALNAYARDLPKGTHLRVRLHDVLSINMCWMKGSDGKYAPYPNIWISAGQSLRRRLQQLRASEYRRWKGKQAEPVKKETQKKGVVDAFNEAYAKAIGVAMREELERDYQLLQALASREPNTYDGGTRIVQAFTYEEDKEGQNEDR